MADKKVKFRKAEATDIPTLRLLKARLEHAIKMGDCSVAEASAGLNLIDSLKREASRA